MAISADLLDAPGRPATPAELIREVVPDPPVILVGPSATWDAFGVTAWLEARGWSWTHAADAERARWLASIQKVSLVLVAGDERTVWAIVEAIRPVTMAPLVVLARPAPAGVVSLVGVGVDAVVDPTCGAEEVFARVVALLRRSDHGWVPGVRYLGADGLRVDLWAQECDLHGRPLHLSPTEYALLTFLMTHPQQALPARTIVRRVWGWLPSDGKNTLRIFVNRLRRKLDDDPRQPRYIASVRGTGYRFVGNVAEMGDEAETAMERTDVALLLQSIEVLATTVAGCDTGEECADQLLDALDASGYADAMSVFQVEGARMRLVTTRNMPAEWVASVRDGVPLSPGFASAASVLSREVVHLGDIRHMSGQFADTAERAASGGYRACLFLPVVSDGNVWGHVGLVRKARQPFDPTGTSYLQAACAVFALALRHCSP
jgi:DNA-binding response OmpR family regulator